MIALLAAAALSFAPPLDRPLQYEIRERRPRGDGSVRGATLTQEVTFATDAGGYLMTVRTTGYRSTLPPAQSGAFDVVMKPMVGTTVRIRLSRGGVPLQVIGGATYWSAMLASLRAQIAARSSDDPASAPAKAMLAALEATPPDARDARLLAGADDLLGSRLPPVAVGAEVRVDHGTVAREADAGDDARFREVSTRDSAGRTLRIEADVALSRATGLVTHSLRRTAVESGTDTLVLSETETVLIL